MTESHISAQDLFKIVTLSDPRFSPNGNTLAYVRTEMDEESNNYKSAIWLAATDGSRTRQFTSGDKKDSAPRWSPDGKWLAFVSNRGDEKAKAQLYLIPSDGGEARQLTKMENGAGEPVWSPDGKRLAFTSRLNAEEMAAEDEPEPETPLDPDETIRRAEQKEKAEKEKADPRVIDRFAYRAETSFFDDRTKHLYVIEVELETGKAEGKPRRLTSDARNYHNPRWLPDGQDLVAMVDRKPGADDLFYRSDIIHVPLDGEAKILTDDDTIDYSPCPSPDGRWIAYNSNPGDEFTIANIEIRLVPTGAGEPRLLTAELDAHAVDVHWAPDSQSLYFLVLSRGRIDLHRVSVDGGPIDTLITAEREVLAFDLSPDGQQVGFISTTDRTLPNLFVANIDGAGEKQLTQANGEWLAEKTLGEVEELWFESADGTTIHGWIVKPPDFDPEKEYPMILSIHGGPHAMWSRHELTMWHEWQMQAASGYVVFASNPRGSDGYGYDFRSSLRNHWGEADLPDLMAGVEQVIAKGYVDPERLCITGGSYGGFMTAWVIGHDDRFKAAVSQRGVYDLISFYSTTDIPLLMERSFFATPWDDPQHLWKYSPVAHVENIHTPLLIIHSDNDFRAPIPAAEGLFVALRRLKREVQLVRYPREGHELSRSGEPKHRIDRLERIVRWFDCYVKEPAESEE